MKTIHVKLSAVIIAALFILSACNKELETFANIDTTLAPNPVVGTIGTTIAANPNDSLFYKLLVRSGQLPLLNDSTKRFTIFAVDNAGMRIFVNAASGGLVPLAAPDAAFVSFINNNLPVASAAGIIQYNIIGQQQYFPTTWAPAFPNFPLPSLIQLDPVNTPFLRMTICPSQNNGINYVNNIPVFNPALAVNASNGVIHHSYTIAAPPTKLLRDLMSTDTALTFFRAAVLRGDVGQIVKINPDGSKDSTNFLNYLMGYGPLNMTVLCPNNNAMKAAIDSIIYPSAYDTAFSTIYNIAIGGGATPAQATAIATAQAPGFAHAASTANASNPAIFNQLPVAAVRAIVAYHILASNNTGSFKPDIRLWSVNAPTTAKFVTTLVNASSTAAAAHLGIRVVATFAGPTPTSVKLTGYGKLKEGWGTTVPANPTPYVGVTASNVIAADKHGVNGIYHVIDRVLLPQ